MAVHFFARTPPDMGQRLAHRQIVRVIGDAQEVQRRYVNGVAVSVINRSVHGGETEGDVGVAMEVAVPKFVMFAAEFGGWALAERSTGCNVPDIEFPKKASSGKDG